jgi:hypothetical protein
VNAITKWRRLHTATRGPAPEAGGFQPGPEFDSIEQAFHFEKRISGWRREKKEAVIRGDYDALIALSRRKPVQDRERASADADAD